MTLQECIEFARIREPLATTDKDFYVYKDCYVKASALLRHIDTYLDSDVYTLVFGNAFLHYVITTPFELEVKTEKPDGTIFTETIQNPLYEKYHIGDKSFIITSTSNAGASASMLVTENMQKGGFLMQDLTRTHYGEYVFSILEQLNLSVVLL